MEQTSRLLLSSLFIAWVIYSCNYQRCMRVGERAGFVVCGARCFRSALFTCATDLVAANRAGPPEWPRYDNFSLFLSFVTNPMACRKSKARSLPSRGSLLITSLRICRSLQGQISLDASGYLAFLTSPQTRSTTNNGTTMMTVWSDVVLGRITKTKSTQS